MASPDCRNEPEWIERLRTEGALPLLEPNNCANGWASPPADIFMVRGPNYFSDRVKVPAGNYLLKLIGFDWVKGSTKIEEILKHPSSRVRKVIENEFPAGDRPFIWAFNLQLPTKENFSAVIYFAATEPISEGSLLHRFLKEDDRFRNSRLKLIANIVKGPWIVKKAVGEQAICVLGRALSCRYCVCENFIEVDIDIGSSMVASAIIHLAFGYITSLTVDLAFLVESQTDSELPEQLLGAVRFSELNPGSAVPVDLPPNGSPTSLQASLPTRLWKSLGLGFSNLIHHGPHESSSTSNLAQGNGDHECEDSNVPKNGKS